MIDSRRDRIGRNIVWIVTGTLVALTIYVGPMHQAQFANDVVTFLDACDRLYLRQRLHVDFQSPLGAAAFAPFVAAMRITGPNAHALSLGAAFCLGSFALWGWWVARSRLAMPAAVVTALFIGLLGGSAYALDFGGWDRPSYAMFYNRIAWALFVLIALECAVPPPHPAARGAVWGAVSTGVALGSLVLLKVNFALVVGVLAIGATVVSGRASWPRFLAVATGALAAALALAVIAPYSVGGYARELAGLAGMQTTSTFAPIAARVLRDNAAPLGMTLVAVMAFACAPLPARARWQGGLQLALVVGAGFTLSLANCQYAELPIFPLAFVIGGEFVRRMRPTARWAEGCQLIAMLPVLIYSAPNAALPLRELAWQRTKAPLASDTARISTPSLDRLILTPWPGEPLNRPESAALWDGGDSSPFSFAQWVNDGIGLLRPRLRPGARVLSMDWSNPFPFALNLPPPRGDHIAWHWDRVVSDRHHPPPDKLFHDVDLVMVPRFGAQPNSIAAKLRVYGPALRAEFQPIASSEIWTLWTRK